MCGADERAGEAGTDAAAVAESRQDLTYVLIISRALFRAARYFTERVNSDYFKIEENFWGWFLV